MQPEQQPPNQWQFQAEGQPATSTPAPESDESVSWSASEFVAYHKSSGWYFRVVFVIVLFVVGLFFLTRDIISSVSLGIMGILFLVFAGRKPRVLNYAVDEDGVHIGDKTYGFSSLRSFAVIDEGSLKSITLLPLKRFVPAVSMYFEPQDEDRIVETLGSYLPEEDRKQDAVDRFMHKIRF